MAKKAKVEATSGSIFDIINSVDNGCELIEESAGAQITEYISTGSYILNAAITGSMFRGIPCGRVTTLAGEPGAGKSFLALSVCREAQKQGYVPIYLDSEGAQDVNSVSRLGVDTKRFMIKQVNTISEVSTFILNLCTKLEAIPEENRDKVIIVLDSLGNLTSNKEAEDILNATGKRDMTKQQEIKALFRVSATPLAKLHIPFIVVSHIYQTQDLFSKAVVSGGCLAPDEEIIMSDKENGEYTECKKIKDIKVGDYVMTASGNCRKVLKTFEFEKPTIEFEFTSGATIKCSYDHKFLRFVGLNEDNVCKYEWCKAKDLDINEQIHYWNVSENGKAYPDDTRVDKKVIHSMSSKVYDICVEDEHTYVSKNGIINHNSGINYNSSVTLMLSAAKLNGADKDNDKAAENAKGELMKTGVIVTAKPNKSRFTIPQKVSFYIPFFKAPNPYVGLDQYMTWENSGIGKGKCYTQKEYDKLKPAEQNACIPFEFEGETKYALLKDSARTIVVSHLGCDIPVNELFTPKVFTEEYMKKFDDSVIKPSFELPDQSKWDNDDELVNELIDEIVE